MTKVTTNKTDFEDQRQGHPSGLFTLAGLEMWERLSFYGLQVILAYYIYYSVVDGGLGMSEAQGLAIAGAYGGAVYLMQPVGAWFADRVLAVRYVILLSGFIIIGGHITIAVTTGFPWLLAGLGLITIGTGGLFPNVLALMGSLYDELETKRDAGFSLFYTMIMVGALLGPIITGYLQVRFGFHVAFTAAAVGMALGLILYFSRWKSLPAAARIVPDKLDTPALIKAVIFFVVIIALVTVAFVAKIIRPENINTAVLVLILFITVAYFLLMYKSPKITAQERHKVVAFIPIMIVGIIFWTLVLQLFTTFAYFADTRVDLELGPFVVPPAYISTFQVVAGIIAGPIIAMVWQKLRTKQPSAPTKMAMGLGAMALAYAVFAFTSLWSTGLVSLIPVIGGMTLFGIAEVAFAPIGISASNQLAPKAFHAQVMAMWGLTTGAGASLSGFVAQFYDATSEPLYFGITAIVTLVTAVIMFSLRPWFQKRGVA